MMVMRDHEMLVHIGQLFVVTPRKSDGERVTLLVNRGDFDSVVQQRRQPGWELVVLDQPTKTYYRLRGAPCALENCNCDAEIVDGPAHHA